MQAMLKTRKSRDPETSLMPINLTREEHVGVRGSPEPPGWNKGSAQAPEPAVPEGRGRPAAGPSDVLDLAPAVPRALCVGDTHFAAPPPGRGSLQGRTKKGIRRLSCSPKTFARRSPSLSPRWAELRSGGRTSRAAGGGHVTGARASDWLGAPGPRPEGRASLPGCGAAGPGDASSGALGCGHFGRLAIQAAVAVGALWVSGGWILYLH